MILAGRGFGKTRAGAETIKNWVESEKYKRIALLGATEAEVRSVMIDGESGLINISPEAKFECKKLRLVWPNGAKAFCFSAINFEKIRGSQFDAAWIDELAKFRYAQEAWDQLAFALRLGKQPRVIITTTPRPIQIIQQLLSSPSVAITKGTTFDNAANLPDSFLESIKERFEGTRLGLQEIYGEIVDEMEGALWSHSLIDKQRIDTIPTLTRIVIGVDPATTGNKTSDETGIIIAGLGENRYAYILEDLSLRGSPGEWALAVVNAFKRHQADRIIAEVNNGGDLVESIIRTIDPHISFKAVRATRGKLIRAEPIVALYEQGKIFHVNQGLVHLENQMCTYIPGVTTKSPDRMDALVWALTELMLANSPTSDAKIWHA